MHHRFQQCPLPPQVVITKNTCRRVPRGGGEGLTCPDRELLVSGRVTGSFQAGEGQDQICVYKWRLCLVHGEGRSGGRVEARGAGESAFILDQREGTWLGLGGCVGIGEWFGFISKVFLLWDFV